MGNARNLFLMRMKRLEKPNFGSADFQFITVGQSEAATYGKAPTRMLPELKIGGAKGRTLLLCPAFQADFRSCLS